MTETSRRLFLLVRPVLLIALAVVPWGAVAAEPKSDAQAQQDADPKQDPNAPPKADPKAPAGPKRSVILILDCSHSMSAAVTGPGGVRTTRMEEAKAVCRNFIPRVAGNCDVGVYLYGHRAGWQSDPQKPREVLLQKKYANPPPENLQPYEDVERVFPLGPLLGVRQLKLFDTLDTVKPWGETPLYLAIREALADFPAGGGPPSIVVITDGHNDVFQPPRDKLVTKNMLLQALQKQPVPIHIVGFQLSPNERQAAVADFKEISETSKGSYYEAGTTAQLERQLTGAAGAAK